MKYVLFAVISLVISSTIVHAQDQSIFLPSNPYLQFLIDSKESYLSIYDPSFKLSTYKDKKDALKFYKLKDHLYLKIEGTGKIYEYKNISKDSLFFGRIDSTVYQGYNFNDYSFIKNDTLFSYGGYGLWNINGQLRYFSKSKKGWELKPLEKWIPITKWELIDFRLSNGQLYTYQEYSAQQQGFFNDKKEVLDSIYKIDLQNGSISSIGNATTSLKEIIAPLGYIQTNNGILIVSIGQIKLLDFESNKISEWKSIEIDNLFNSIGFEAGIKIFSSSSFGFCGSFAACATISFT